MNAVEIEEAVAELCTQPFDAAGFPYSFIEAFGAKDATVKRIRSGESNKTDIDDAVLWHRHIHIAVAPDGGVGDALGALRASSKTHAAKAKFILATDGALVEAEEIASGEIVACAFGELADHFGFFLPLAGITTVAEIKNNPFDIKATGRLNRLYLELLKDNPDWASDARRHDLNQFMARLIFCYFAEDTGIFHGDDLFTSTIRQMSDANAEAGSPGSTERVIGDLFKAMNIDPRVEKRSDHGLRNWADGFPFVNGGLFTDEVTVPHFSKVARSYLLRVGELNWTEINPDIFGSMIQAVADEGERGALGMHYTSVPNIMKVLGPLFLDDLKAKLAEAGDNARKLKNLRKRLARIRVFDPACGSGNFLVIAYKEMRAIEAEIVSLTDAEPKSVIPLKNFYGIEIKDFAAEIARLSLLIAEFQCDCRYLSQSEARMLVLPLKRTGHIVCGNALRLDWRVVCPPEGGGGTQVSEDDRKQADEKPICEEQDLGGGTGRLNLSSPPEDAGTGTRRCRSRDRRSGDRPEAMRRARDGHPCGRAFRNVYLRQPAVSGKHMANAVSEGRSQNRIQSPNKTGGFSRLRHRLVYEGGGLQRDDRHAC